MSMMLGNGGVPVWPAAVAAPPPPPAGDRPAPLSSPPWQVSSQYLIQIYVLWEHMGSAAYCPSWRNLENNALSFFNKLLLNRLVGGGCSTTPPPPTHTTLTSRFRNNQCKDDSALFSRFLHAAHASYGPVLLATAAKLGIRQERGTRDKPSQ